MTAERPRGGGPTARGLAAHVVARVVGDGAFAAAALESELGHAVQLEARDRALATELAYGTLRALPWLRAEVGRFAPRGLGSLDARVEAHLMVAAYQLFFLRLPAFAAVNEAVRAVRASRDAKLGGFVNAVLRKVATRAEGVTDADRAEAVFASVPAWLRAALERSVGAEQARALLLGDGGAPATALRIERVQEREAWRARLAEAAPAGAFELGRVSPRAILARGAGPVARLPGFGEGAWAVQEEGAQLSALAVGARAGERVLDACAGRGNKTAVLARAVGATGAVDACDASPAKLERLAKELGRLGLAARATHAVDWTAGAGDVTELYDAVLVDAPCTGVGTLRRRPEIALRLTEPDLLERPRAQLAIASRAAERVRPGGTVVYVVCSVLREEAEDVMSALLAAHPELTPAAFEAPEVRAIFGETSAFRLLPGVEGTDGYFVARVRRGG